MQTYKTLEKILSDNREEFANSNLIDICKINIEFKLTRAEAQFRNGWVERRNFIIATILQKVIEESNIDISLALLWCINAKNSLAKVHGFSPFQLALGQNPKLSSINPQQIYKQIQVRY